MDLANPAWDPDYPTLPIDLTPPYSAVGQKFAIVGPNHPNNMDPKGP